MNQVAVHELAAPSAVVRRMGGRLKRRTDLVRDGVTLRRVADEYGSRGAAGCLRVAALQPTRRRSAPAPQSEPISDEESNHARTQRAFRLDELPG